MTAITFPTNPQPGDAFLNFVWDGEKWRNAGSPANAVILKDLFEFSVAADDSTLKTVSTGESIKFIGTSGITTSSDAEGNITITQGTTSSLVNSTKTVSLGSDGVLTLPANGRISAASGYNLILGDGLLLGQGGSIFNENEDGLYLGGQNSDAGTYIQIPGRTASENGEPLIISHQWDGAIDIQGGGGIWSFGSDDSLTFPDDTVQTTAWTGVADYNNLINKPNLVGTYQFSVAADDSTQRVISTDEVVKFIGAGGITTASDAEGAITITQGSTDQIIKVAGSFASDQSFKSEVIADLTDGVSISTWMGLPQFATNKTWKFGYNGNLTFPDSTVQSTAWTGSVAYSSVTGTPTLATVATSGSYADLSSKPTIYTSAYIGTTSLAFNRSSASQTLNGVSIDGSAATLTTARNINGVSFDGSANINVPRITDGTNILKIVPAPTTLAGQAGDLKGNIAFTDTYLYYCKTAYGGTSYVATASSGQTAAYVRVRKSIYYTPAAGWTITFGTPVTITSVTDAGVVFGYDSWQLNLASSVSSTGGSDYVLTDTSNAIWVQIPWTTVAPADTLTGTTLNSTVVNSSLTSVGTLRQLAVTGSVTADSFNTDQVTVVGNRIATTVTNANLELEPNGTGNITISTGTIVGTQTTQNVFNTTATTVNFAGAATTLNIGTSAGIVNIASAIKSGTGTFTKTGYATGDILLDNGGTDSPGLLMYYGNNNNFGIDSYNGTFSVLSGQLIRVTNNLNESGGAVKAAIDTTGNLATAGFVQPGAWRAGQVIRDTMLNNSEFTVNNTTVATSTTDTTLLTYSYTPTSSSSYLIIHVHVADYRAASDTGGAGTDSYFSRIKVDDAEIVYARQMTRSGEGFRTGSLFPLTGRYTNSSTTAKTITVAVRRDSADDSITVTSSATALTLRITEIAR